MNKRFVKNHGPPVFSTSESSIGLWGNLSQFGDINYCDEPQKNKNAILYYSSIFTITC